MKVSLPEADTWALVDEYDRVADPGTKWLGLSELFQLNETVPVVTETGSLQLPLSATPLPAEMVSPSAARPSANAGTETSAIAVAATAARPARTRRADLRERMDMREIPLELESSAAPCRPVSLHPLTILRPL